MSTAAALNARAPRRTEPPLVLVVDDEPLHQELHCMMLHRAGYRAMAAESAAEALSLFDAVHPDVVVTDLSMPDVDGFGLVARLRARPDGAHVPVVMVTASAPEVPLSRALVAGVSALLPKPVVFVDLVVAVADALGQPRRAAS